MSNVSALVRAVLLACSVVVYTVSGVLFFLVGLRVSSPEVVGTEDITVLALAVLTFLVAVGILGRVFRCRRSSFMPLALVLAGFAGLGVAATHGVGPLLLLSLGLLAILGLIAAVWTDALIKRGP